MVLLDGEPGTGDVVDTCRDPLVYLTGKGRGREEGGLVTDLDDVGRVAVLGLLDPRELEDLEGLADHGAGRHIGLGLDLLSVVRVLRCIFTQLHSFSSPLR